MDVCSIPSPAEPLGVARVQMAVLAPLDTTFEKLWQAALGATWHHSPVWVHGNISAGNLLVDRGTLSAVIDFGCSGVGDLACDVTIAWTFLSGDSREAF
jgi:aminoglycoside phosphotransferase (APT) family kinase protein